MRGRGPRSRRCRGARVQGRSDHALEPQVGFPEVGVVSVGVGWRVSGWGSWGLLWAVFKKLMWATCVYWVYAVSDGVCLVCV